ncbi:MAG: exodeoxyribonuclease III [Treponemataceae bacterium]|nr:MAG: exodeoxyribonuclease III [Treponemataceae bacterium]
MAQIISWNVNGIRAVEKKDFVQYLLSSNADVFCVQETKANPEQLSESLKAPSVDGEMRYKSYFASARKAGYSGTAIYAKREPDNVYSMGDARFDDEGRVLCADFGKLTVICAYFPNSQEEGARLPYKLDFCAAMLDFCTALVARGQHIVLCGDYNIAHKPIDLARPQSNEHNPGYFPEERSWMDTWTSSGFCDTFRHFCAEPNHYTWWSYRFHAREKNIGWRIDYTCVNEAFLPQVKASAILKDVHGSDHCPIAIDLDIVI